MGSARGLIVAGSASGSGKTVATLGLIAALRRRGMRVAAAKCGPDYIDPRFLEAASGAPAVNLDPWAMRAERLAALAATQAAGADLQLYEQLRALLESDKDGPVWWDPQVGLTSDVPPPYLVNDSSRLASIPIPPDTGVNHAGPTSPDH
jgi:cobyrinic acid a,c-diamide synthase